jgi:hypothetical protein
MPAFPTADRRANRTAVAREARRIAEEIEALHIQFEQIGALTAIRQYMIRNQEGIPNFDMLQAAKALRCYAGVLSMIASATPPPESRESR